MVFFHSKFKIILKPDAEIGQKGVFCKGLDMLICPEACLSLHICFDIRCFRCQFFCYYSAFRMLASLSKIDCRIARVQV